jgi:UDP-4-amino-4,6-dideoxy-N-acetyl-beta-L-altrosamine N-acetyltransferase
MIELKNFIDLKGDEREMVLSWRNHESVRSYMYTDEIITLEHHNSFIDSLHHRPDKAYFIVVKNGAPIGVVDLIDITETSASLGLYANPFSDRKGIGRIILRALIRYAYEALHLTTLHLECYEENEKAQALYQKFDFIETKRTVKNNKPILYMEHHREHR